MEDISRLVMTQDKTELKPCPFCGEEGILITRNSFGNDDVCVKRYSVICGSISPCVEMAEYNSKADAKKYWNRRVK